MSDPEPRTEAHSPPRRQAEGSPSEALRSAGEHLGRLLSAWAALAPCVAPDCAGEIAEAERNVKRQLLGLARQPGASTPEALEALGCGLDGFADRLRQAAFACEVPALYGGLAAGVSTNRVGMLELLDLLTADAFGDSPGLASKLRAVDALITVLCTQGDPKNRIAPRDPVTLTPALRSLCERAQAGCQTSLAETEAAFFNAANLAIDLADPGPLRELGARKAKLGRSYFVPGMLRAIVTYNMALLQSTPPETWGTDWLGIEGPTVAPASPPGPSGSVFESEALRALLRALQRRLADASAEPDAMHRIAWALDLDDLTSAEIAALRAGQLDPGDLHGAILLVGLIYRAREVVAIELQEIGVDPDQVPQRWAGELDERVRQEVKDSISLASSDRTAYDRACILSGLRNRFLHGVAPAELRHVASRRQGEALEQSRMRRQARSLASEAIADGSRAPVYERGPTLRQLPRQRVVLTVAIVVAALTAALLLLAPVGFFDPDVERWSRGQLANVSEHLVDGRRNGAGAGPSFVGTLGDDWLALSPIERERSARALVAGLRAQGVSRVMLYDARRTLLIQALGDTLRLHIP